MPYYKSWPALLEAMPTCFSEQEAQKIKQHLLAPFDTEAALEACWQELDNTVLVISVDDDLSSLSTLPDEIKRQLHHTVHYPEFIDQFSFWRLQLGIFNDAGSGMYLIFPDSELVLGQLFGHVGEP